jgi:hypothetical protein
MITGISSLVAAADALGGAERVNAVIDRLQAIAIMVRKTKVDGSPRPQIQQRQPF